MACLASSLRTAFSLAWPTSRHLPKASLTDASGAQEAIDGPGQADGKKLRAVLTG